MDKPDFSVIVPVYNVGKYLKDCINSILEQSYECFELIIVDDGSTDGCREICDSYREKDKRIKVIHKQNAGLVSARKDGVSAAIGSYAVCVDGDDWISRNFLEAVNEVIKSSNPDIICFNSIYVKNDSYVEHPPHYRKGFYSREDIISEIYPSLIHNEYGRYFPPSLGAKVYKMDLYRSEQLAVSNDIVIGEDAACSLSCIAKAKNMFILDRPLYYYRVNNTSMTKSRKPFPDNGPALLYNHLKQRLGDIDEGFDSQIERKTVHDILNVVKSQFYCEEKYRAIRKKIMMILEDPLYYRIVKECHYRKFSIMFFFHVCLKQKIFFPIYVLSKIR